MRRLAVAILIVAPAAVSVPLAPARTQPVQRNDVLVVVVPQAEARALVPDNEGASALVVCPPTRSVRCVFQEISAGAPTGTATGIRPGRPGALREALDRRGVGVDLASATTARNPLLPLMLSAFTRPLQAPALHVADHPETFDPGGQLLVMTARTAAEVVATRAWRRRSAIIVLGVPDDLTAPVRLITRHARGLVLGDGSTRRPGVATPYDVAGTVLGDLGEPHPAAFIGRPLRALPERRDPGYVDAIEARFRRDIGYAQSLTAWTVGIGLGFGFVAALMLVAAGRQAASARLATGASFATAGFLAGLFIPSGRGDLRAIPVAAGLVLGTFVRSRDRVRFVAAVFACVAVAMGVLALTAAANPGGEPALSLWGNPLVSSRYFGMQNYQAAFVAGGVIAAAALGASAAVLAACAVVAAFVIGWPWLGANYVGVVTLAFGAAVAVQFLRAGRLRPRHLAMAVVTAVGAFALALVAARIAGTGHGGRVAGEISGGGVSAIIDVTLDRLRLNAEAIRAFPGGIVWTAMFSAVLVCMILWALRDGTRPVALRGAVAAGAMAAGAALVLEDSGFKTCAVLGFPALMLWTLQIVNDPRAVVTTVLGRRARDDAGVPAIPPPPPQR